MSAGRRGDLFLVGQQVLLGLGLLLLWEMAGLWSGSRWVSQPTLVLSRLWEWSGDGLFRHIGVTLSEMVIGLALGGSLGLVAGLLLGRSPVLATVLRPAIVGFYSVPLVALAPLLIMFFGLDMTPKIILITIVSFFLLFFNTFSGATSVDKDLISSVQLMGANRLEQFRKVIAPGCMVWILSGFKTALPYALVGATTGEMLASRAGMGFLIARSASQLDTTGIYASLVVLMVIGLILSELATRCDRWILRWRPETV